MHTRLILLALPLLACSKAVKHEGFRASVTAATDAALVGRYESESSASCAVLSEGVRELRLRGEGLSLDVADAPLQGERAIEAVVSGERFVLDRAGAESVLVLDMPRGRFIGSLTATLIHESAGTNVDGRPAPVRELSIEATFNLQPCP